MSNHRLLNILDNGNCVLYDFESDSERSDVKFPEGEMGEQIKTARTEDFGRNEIIVKVQDGKIIGFVVNSPG